MFTSKYIRTITRIKKEYMKTTTPWLLAYSGGKDSTAVLELVTQAMANAANCRRLVYVVFCDTGVENPIIIDSVRYVFRRVNAFARQNNLPISTHVVRPEKKNRFWIKVIGRGCPPPTNKFRWCTDKLRVNPLREFCVKHGLTNGNYHSWCAERGK